MLRWMAAVLIAAALTSPGVAAAQDCAHGRDETPEERTRREDALQAVRLINAAQGTRPFMGGYIPWDRLGLSDYVISLRGDGSRGGELARRMNWGGSEVLPGWRVHFVATLRAYAFSLHDVRDPCGLTYSSDDTGAVVRGYPVDRERTLRPATP